MSRIRLFTLVVLCFVCLFKYSKFSFPHAFFKYCFHQTITFKKCRRSRSAFLYRPRLSHILAHAHTYIHASRAYNSAIVALLFRWITRDLLRPADQQHSRSRSLRFAPRVNHPWCVYNFGRYSVPSPNIARPRLRFLGGSVNCFLSVTILKSSYNYYSFWV